MDELRRVGLLDDGTEDILDVGDDAFVLVVVAIETAGDIGGFLIGQHQADEVGEGGMGGMGVDEAEMDQGMIEVMPLPADVGLELQLVHLVLSQVAANVLPYPAEGVDEQTGGHRADANLVRDEIRERDFLGHGFYGRGGCGPDGRHGGESLLQKGTDVA